MRQEPQHKETEAAPILANEMCLGPFPGTEAGWQGAACIHNINLSYPPKQGGRMETGAGNSPWPTVLLNPTQKQGRGEVAGTGPRAKNRATNFTVGRTGSARGTPVLSNLVVLSEFQPLLWTRKISH